MADTLELTRRKRSAPADPDRLLGGVGGCIQELRERSKMTQANFPAAGITQADGAADGSTALKQRAVAEVVRRMGGGPRLKFAEWVTLIHLHQTYGHDRDALKLAIATASQHPEAGAAATGRPRPGTRLRSASGLMRRLTVVRALAAGQRTGQPLEARAAWHLIETSPDEAHAIATGTLGGEASLMRHEPARSAAPARGPTPSFGKFELTRADGATEVYLMRLVGTRSRTLTDAEDDLVFVKIGRSAEPFRRLDEMNWGFPPDCGLNWQLEDRKRFECAQSAHRFEQAMLKRLHGAGLTIGGEYARVPAHLVPRLLGSGDLDGTRTQDGHLHDTAVDANRGRRG